MEVSSAITVERYNPLFNDADKLFQDISYPGKAPLTKQNKLFFYGGHLVEAKNDTYQFDVQVNISGVLFFIAVCAYKHTSSGFEFTLKPDFGSIAEKVKNARLPEIRTNDAEFFYRVPYADFEDLMLNTCINPGNYSCAFFPVLNPHNVPDPGKSFGFINYFSYSEQRFNVKGQEGVPDWETAQAPWFRLNYIIKRLAAYLNLSTKGSYFDDPESEQLYIYTRQCLGFAEGSETMTIGFLPSMAYMPNLTVADFFKQIRERLHIAIDFNLTEGVLTIESFRSIANSKDVFDLAPYISQISNQEPPVQKGYRVVLKPDEQDELFSYTENEEIKYKPDFELITGTAENLVELECSTLKKVDLSVPGIKSQTYPSTSQDVSTGIPGGWEPQPSDANDPTTANNWPLRLLKYNGMVQLQAEPAGLFPEAVPFDLNQDDMLWYRFLNDSKYVTLRGYFPPTVLANMRTTGKYSFLSNEGFYSECVIEKISYNMGESDRLIIAELQVRTLNFSIETIAEIQDISSIENDPEDGTLYSTQVKAYFDPAIHNFTSVEAEIIYHRGGGIDQAGYMAPITNPTDKWGVGGTYSWIRKISNTPLASPGIIMRIRKGVPKYIRSGYVTFPFVYNSLGYYEAMFFPSTSPYWIVF